MKLIPVLFLITSLTFHKVQGSSCPTNCKAGQTCTDADGGCPECETMYYGRQCQHRVECKISNNGTEYRGTLDTTPNIACQRWDSQSPHTHVFVGDELEENYCRNPDNVLGPWCYTVDPHIRWRYCEVSMCECTFPSLNSSTHVKVKENLEFIYGSKVTVECDSTTESSVLECGVNNQWAGTLPTCQEEQEEEEEEEEEYTKAVLIGVCLGSSAVAAVLAVLTTLLIKHLMNNNHRKIVTSITKIGND